MTAGAPGGAPKCAAAYLDLNQNGWMEEAIDRDASPYVVTWHLLLQQNSRFQHMFNIMRMLEFRNKALH